MNVVSYFLATYYTVADCEADKVRKLIIALMCATVFMPRVTSYRFYLVFSLWTTLIDSIVKSFVYRRYDMDYTIWPI